MLNTSTKEHSKSGVWDPSGTMFRIAINSMVIKSLNFILYCNYFLFELPGESLPLDLYLIFWPTEHNVSIIWHNKPYVVVEVLQYSSLNFFCFLSSCIKGIVVLFSFCQGSVWFRTITIVNRRGRRSTLFSQCLCRL